jgi:hypothetical protein
MARTSCSSSEVESDVKRTDNIGLRKPIMKKIFTTKISLQSSNPTFSYPIIRLPRELKELAGRIANVYQTEIDGAEGFFIALQLDNLDKLDKFVENKECSENPILASAGQKKTKIKRPSRDLNPSRSLDSLGKPVH